MNNLTLFDVLIVYTELLAKSASGDLAVDVPFAKGSPNESYNVVYGYFLETCARFGLKAAFTTSADISGPGQCSCFWVYEKSEWRKVNSPGFSSLIFDKFSPTRKRIRINRELLFSSDSIRSFNNPDLFNLFFDKQRTFDELSEHSIPTVSVEVKTAEGAKNACRRLTKMVKKSQNSADFGDEVVMKDRFGAGGRRVFKFGAKEFERMNAKIQSNPSYSYIIQPLVKFEKGFNYDNSLAPTDIRLIYLNKKLIQSYIRRARPGDFRCNEHQGGSLSYLSLREIPKKLIEKSDLISDMLDHPNSFYALDFIVSNNGNVYFLEGNAGPGLDWNLSLKRNEIEGKKLIRLIVGELLELSESDSESDAVVSPNRSTGEYSELFV